jgi:hypothetical protein
MVPATHRSYGGRASRGPFGRRDTTVNDDHGGASMSDSSRTTSPPLTFERSAADGSCPVCAAEDLATYPVNSEGGWFTVVKCQQCLHSLSRERWTLLGPIQLLSDSL